MYMCAPSLCLAETITSLIETKTIADRHFARGRSSRGETSGGSLAVSRRERPSTIVVLLLANRVPVSPPLLPQEVERGRNRRAVLRARFTRMHPVVPRRRRRGVPYARIRPRNSLRDGGSDIPFYPAHAVALHPTLFTTRHPRKGTWGSAVYLHGDTQARVYVRAHALPQPSL